MPPPPPLTEEHAHPPPLDCRTCPLGQEARLRLTLPVPPPANPLPAVTFETVLGKACPGLNTTMPLLPIEKPVAEGVPPPCAYIRFRLPDALLAPLFWGSV